MFKKVKPYMGNNTKYTYGALAVMLIGLIASSVPYFMIYRIIEPLLSGRSLSASYYIVHIVIIAACELVYAILYVLELRLSHISAYNTLKNIRLSLQKKLEHQPLGALQDMGSGKIKKLFTDDIEQIEMLLAHAIPEGISNIAIAAIALICMFIADWKLALLSLCSLPLGFFAMGMMFRTGMKRMNDYYAASSKMNSTIIEYVNGMEVVKVFGRDGESYKRYETDIKSYRDFTLAWYKACWGWMALYSSLLPCVALFMLPIGTLLVINSASTLADLVLVFCLSLSIGVPLLKALNFAGKFPQLNFRIEEIEKAMNNQPLKTNDNSFIGNSHIVKFDDVHFAYKEKEVLHSVTLELKQGTMTALVGESGSGKSTVAKLCAGLWDTADGEILIGGANVKELALETQAEMIAYVEQNNYLFDDTVMENIRMGRAGASDEEVINAAKAAGCDEFIRALEKGYQTVVGSAGGHLSGGEGQRVAIARAMLKDAPIVILDEATAYIDPENEEKMTAAIAQVIKGKTVLVIAHRLQTIMNADNICVLKDGGIIAQGKHEGLLENCGEYRKLWHSSESSAKWTIGNEVRA